MKRELQVEILNVTDKVYRLLHKAEKINDVAQRDRVRSHLQKAYDQLNEAHLKLQSNLINTLAATRHALVTG